MSKYGVFSGQYTEPYSVQMRKNTDQKNLLTWTLSTECQLLLEAKLGDDSLSKCFHVQSLVWKYITGPIYLYTIGMELSPKNSWQLLDVNYFCKELLQRCSGDS